MISLKAHWSRGMSEGFKVYLLCECDWVVAESKSQAIDCWEGTTGETFEKDEMAIEIEDRPLSDITYWYNDIGGKTTSFENRIKEVLETKEDTVPFFLATSEF